MVFLFVVKEMSVLGGKKYIVKEKDGFSAEEVLSINRGKVIGILGKKRNVKARMV